MTFVAAEKETFAAPFGPLTWIVVPDTDAMDPATSSSPFTFTGVADVGDAAGVEVAGVVGDSPGELLVDGPQAMADDAVIPMSANTERRVNDAFRTAAPVG